MKNRVVFSFSIFVLAIFSLAVVLPGSVAAATCNPGEVTCGFTGDNSPMYCCGIPRTITACSGGNAVVTQTAPACDVRNGQLIGCKRPSTSSTTKCEFGCAAGKCVPRPTATAAPTVTARPTATAAPTAPSSSSPGPTATVPAFPTVVGSNVCPDGVTKCYPGQQCMPSSGVLCPRGRTCPAYRCVSGYVGPTAKPTTRPMPSVTASATTTPDGSTSCADGLTRCQAGEKCVAKTRIACPKGPCPTFTCLRVLRTEPSGATGLVTGAVSGFTEFLYRLFGQPQ